MNANLISLAAQNLTKHFDHFTAVDDVSFSVQRGEIYGLLGPNGAGKPTTIHCCWGYLRRPPVPAPCWDSTFSGKRKRFASM